MKNAKKLLSFLLSVTVILSGMTGLFVTVSAEEVTIASVEDFKTISLTENITYKITADIDFAAAGETAYQLATFAGVLTGAKADGTNPVITLNGKALVDTLTGTIENITTAGSVNEANTNRQAGAFANIAKTNALLKNCVNNAAVTVKGTYVGGLIGRVTGETGNSTSVNVQNSKNTAVISNATASSSTAGLIGSGYGITISCSSNQGAVNGSGNVAGIMGYIDNNFVTISETFNSGAITGTGNKGSFAGIVANGSQNSSAKKLSIENCFNTGDITANSATYNNYGISGIVNRIYNSNATYGIFELKNCYNAGKLIETANGKGSNIVHSLTNVASITSENNYYLKENGASEAEAIPTGISSKTEIELKNLENLIGFSTDIWQVESNMEYTYPTLIHNPYPNTPIVPGETKENPILITDQTEFQGMDSDKYYKLNNDITLDETYTPFVFQGKLDGNGKTVALGTRNNISGLFEELSGESFEVTNLILTGDLSRTGDVRVGALASSINAVASGSVTDITNKANITVKDDEDTFNGYVGGILGKAEMTTKNSVTLRNLKNEGTLQGKYVGGILYSLIKNELSDSTNIGTLKGNYAGGIVYTAANIVALENCYNSADINANVNVAGILGAAGGYNPQITLKKCYNTGTLKTGSNQEAAGIVSRFAPGTSSTKFTCNIDTCYNAGEVAGSFSTNPICRVKAPATSGNLTTSTLTIANCIYATPGAESDAFDNTTPKTLSEIKNISDLNEDFKADLNKIYTVTATAGENGTLTPSGTFYAKSGKEITFYALADDGYYISSFLVKDVEIPYPSNGGYECTITEDTSISVAYLKAGGDLITLGNGEVYTSTEPQLIDGKMISDPLAIVFAQFAPSADYTLKECGVLISTTSIDTSSIASITNLPGNVKVCPSAQNKWNMEGIYGICFFGSMETETTYYVIPYAVFQKNGEEKFVLKFGEQTTFVQPGKGSK